MAPPLLPRSILRIPDHWIGCWKDGVDLCDNIADALVTITPEQLATHAYILGSTGSGKSVALVHLIAADIVKGHSIVVLDPRGDLASSTIELAARSGVDPSLVKFFNLRDVDQPIGFNPLAGEGEPYVKALGLIDAVAADVPSWGIQLEESFRNGALLLAEISAPLPALDRIFHDRAFRLAALALSSKQLRSFWTRYDALSADKQAALAAPVLNKVSVLFSAQVLRRTLSHPRPVDLGTHLRTPGSVTIISLASDQLHGAAWRIGSLFLNSICREVFSQVETPESRRNPLRLVVDEFEAFPTEPFKQILAEGRRFRFSLCLAHQTLAQLSPEARSVILGNVGLKLIFRSSHADAEILNRDLTGDRRRFDIASLRVGEAILWRRGDQAYPVEINAPLINDVGHLSTLARQFLAQMRENEPQIDWASIESPSDGLPEADCPPKRALRHKPTRLDRKDLEDWLK